MADDRTALIELIEKQADSDLVREMLAFAGERIMELEVEPRTGAAKGMRSPLREVQRNGSRERDWVEEDQELIRGAISPTRACRSDHAWDPEAAQGQLSAEFPGAAAHCGEGFGGARHCLSDQWLSNGSLQEAYVQGISTRSVDDLVKAMGAGGMSRSQVSRLCGDIDDRVNAFLRSGPIRMLDRAVTV